MKLHGFNEDGDPVSTDDVKRESAKERKKRIDKFNEIQQSVHKVTESVIHHGKSKDDDIEEEKKDDSV